MLFKFYDNRNKNRLRKLLTQASRSNTLTETLSKDTAALTSVLKRIDAQGPLKENLRKKREELLLTAEELEAAVLDKYRDFDAAGMSDYVKGVL